MLPLLLALLLAAAPAPLRLTSQAFGQPMEIEVRGLPEDAAREAIRQAFVEVADFERLSGIGGLAALNAAAGKGPQPVDPRLLAVLSRAALAVARRVFRLPDSPGGSRLPLLARTQLLAIAAVTDIAINARDGLVLAKDTTDVSNCHAGISSRCCKH